MTARLEDDVVLQRPLAGAPRRKREVRVLYEVEVLRPWDEHGQRNVFWEAIE